jgi:hypothetical protein
MAGAVAGRRCPPPPHRQSQQPAVFTALALLLCPRLQQARGDVWPSGGVGVRSPARQSQNCPAEHPPPWSQLTQLHAQPLLVHGQCQPVARDKSYTAKPPSPNPVLYLGVLPRRSETELILWRTLRCLYRLKIQPIWKWLVQ